MAGGFLLLAGAALPAWLAAVREPAPRARNVHIEAYRYGFSPSRLHASRGDRLRLTFSTRDTGQSFFLQDYDLHVAITPGNRMVAVTRLSRPDDPPVFTDTVEIVAGLPGWRGWLVSKSQFRNHTFNGPLHGTERGELIVGPNLLLWAGLGLLAVLPLAGWLLAGGPPATRLIDLFRLLPWLKRKVKAPSFQFNLALPMLAVFWFVILAGFMGTKVAGRNAGPMVVWVLWLSALILLLVPIGGRAWCTVCPLPLLGEWTQRRRLARNPAELEGRSIRRVFGVPLVWPRRLSNPWPRVVLFLLLGTFSTAIIARPPATSWVLIGMMAMAAATSIFPDQRLFCRHLCPINSYISLYSTTGRVAVRAISPAACTGCSEHFCLTGSAKGWGCPYGLCVSEIDRNNDCGTCLECVKTCAYDNVGVFWRSAGRDEAIADYGEAWQAIVMFALACLYCYINLGAWDRIRNWIDIVDRGNWGTFWVYAAAVWACCLGVLPAVWYGLARAGVRLGGSKRPAADLFRSSTASFIPLGMACWMAFALATLSSMTTFALQSLSDPFDWGWNLLGMAGSRWHIIWAPAIPWLQVACVLTGAAYAMGTLRRCWREGRGGLPQGSFLFAAAAGMIWFFAG